MASLTQSTSSSRDHLTATINSKMKYSPQPTSSSTSIVDTMPLPQCKVKRNYACSKCTYYTQNPRSFLHHQKNVHAERLKVYECSHCLYASKHSQKLQRHVQMVHHVPDRKSNADAGGSVSGNRVESDKQAPLVPPVRIRMQRVESRTERQFGELVIVEDVDMIEGQENDMIDEEANGNSDDVSGDQDETVITVSAVDDDNNDDGNDNDGDDDDDIDDDGGYDDDDGDGGGDGADDEDDDDDDDDDGGGGGGGGGGDNDDDSDVGENNDKDIEKEKDDNNVVGDSSEKLEISPLKSPTLTVKRLEQLQLQHLQKKRMKFNPKGKPSGTKPTFIRCSVCPFGSHSQTLVNRHEKTAHLKKKFFRCMKCNYVTHMRARYTKHVKYHTMPMIKCDDCDFRTPYKWNLDRHNRNHNSTTRGAYKCLHCSFSADIKQSLTVHETNHHVPPVGGVYPPTTNNRRRYRVGASDAPGSSVDGTEIVTYETTKDGGIVEIMTETKSTAQLSSSTAAGSSSKAIVTSVVTTTVVSSSSNSHGTSTVVNSSGTSTAATVAVVPSTSGGTTGATMTTTRVMKPAGLKIVAVVNMKPDKANNNTAASAEKAPQYRRPLPRLIPIADKRQRPPPTVIQLRKSSPPPLVSTSSVTATNPAADKHYYKMAAAAMAKAQSTLGDFASLIDEREVTSGDVTVNTGGTDGPRSNSNSPKSKTTSFFDKLKARVDETADLTCQVCRYESKCLSEFMRHQLTHNVVDDHFQSVVNTRNLITSQPLPPLTPVTAAELKSTRCQRCRKRCKTSTELMAHLATCRGTATVTTTTVDNNNASRSAVEKTGDQETAQQHPMENKIFVWNPALVSTSVDEVTVTPAVEVPKVKASPPATKQEQKTDDDNGADDEEKRPHDVKVRRVTESAPQQKQQSIRKDGKMYKTVFKCPHCTFWAATASRFHVHIVGHLNRKPFECSCCAYRSNWRWDITKHIRLKSARKGVNEESVAVANSHQGAKVLMTDETGRRNYSKYNRYLTVLEMDMADGADKAAGGECEDGRGIASKKVVGGGVARKRRTALMSSGGGGGGVNGGNSKVQMKQHQQQTGRTTADGKLMTKTSPNRNQQQQKEQSQERTKGGNNDVKQSSRATAAGGENRSKTVWKCKKCFFRDCDRLTVLNHVKAHYRRGEFGSGDSDSRLVSKHGSAQHRNKDTANGGNQKTAETKKSAKLKDINQQTMTVTTDCRKTTSTSKNDTLLLLSTNPKTLMLYDDENFLSCPLCDVTVGSSGQLKDHMQRTHIPQETKYRCEYCPFWSEEKKAMLDHMVFAHEMDDSVEINSTDINIQTEQLDECNSLNSNNHNDNDDELLDNKKPSEIEEYYSNNDTPPNTDSFDNQSGNDNDSIITNVNVLFDTNDDNINVVETVECKPDFVEHVEDLIDNSLTLSQSSEKSNYDDINADIICEYQSSCEDNEHVKDDDSILVKGEELSKSAKTVKAINKGVKVGFSAEDGTIEMRQLYECNDCWYFGTNKKDIQAHQKLHVKRGAFYNCTQCTFNVTKAEVLYHHYRYGHMVEEPEIQYPEDSVFRAGFKEMYMKNTDAQQEEKETDESVGPPMVWSYVKESVPPFTRVFKCRYCPHTNRRRHNTVEHERMHSNHPEHQLHRQQQQQRILGTSTPQSPPLHPCKRCTYVCNNAGVLASHVKVHSTSYGNSIVGFYDTGVGDSMQARALESVMELENDLQLYNDHSDNGEAYDSDNEVGSQEIRKYKELDNPKLKFCPYCPARFFFHYDIWCHIRFHQYCGWWSYACNCCSFTARAQCHIIAHETVHCDQYTQRTAELLSSGYSISQRYPQPAAYPVAVNEKALPCRKLSKHEVEVMETCSSVATDSQLKHGTKRPQNSKSDTDSVELLSPQDNINEQIIKRRRRSTTVSVSPVANMTVNSGTVTSPVESEAVDFKSTVESVVDKPKNSYVRSFKCDMCPGRFFKASALQYHKTLHGGTGIHQCRKCDYAVSTYGNLIRHEYVHRDLPPREKVKQLITKVKIEESSNDSEAVAVVGSSSSPSLLPQVQTSNASNSDNEDAVDPELECVTSNSQDFNCPITVTNGMIQTGQYECSKCSLMFDEHDQYDEHLASHGTEDKYQCNKCDYSNQDNASYLEHQQKHLYDIEVKQNYEQVAECTKLSKETDEDQQSIVSAPVDDIHLHETVFQNEISDRQTAYELNTAYGATGTVNGETAALFRCAHCPYECNTHLQLDRHTLHHQETKNTNHLMGSTSKRSWKRGCRFCTYRTYAESDLTEHTKVHFLRSTSMILASMAAVSAHTGNNDDAVENGDYIEYHGKRVMCHQDNENCSDEDDANSTSVNNNSVVSAIDNEPFFVFKDRGTSESLDESDQNRFIPDYTPPSVLIDFNDNRTSGDDVKKKSRPKQPMSYVRFIDGGKRLEFLDEEEGDAFKN